MQPSASLPGEWMGKGLESTSVADIDPVAVHRTLRDHVQQLIRAERDRDVATQRNVQISAQLAELQKEKEAADGRYKVVQHAREELENLRIELENKLAVEQGKVNKQEETNRRLDKEMKATTDKLTFVQRELDASETARNALDVYHFNFII